MDTACKFGYPSSCDDCASLVGDPARSLRVAPFFRCGGRFRLMLVGQDPTVRKRPERVRQVLMLDQPGGQLSRWLRKLIGEKVFDQVTMYATNVVKCSFSKPPSDFDQGGLPFLLPYAEKCRQYLTKEVANYRPDLVISLGEPSHRIFRQMVDEPTAMGESMQEAFTGSFVKASIGHVFFEYTPCLHIQTFRVAETYGFRVESFKMGLANSLARIV